MDAIFELVVYSQSFNAANPNDSAWWQCSKATQMPEIYPPVGSLMNFLIKGDDKTSILDPEHFEVEIVWPTQRADGSWYMFIAFENLELNDINFSYFLEALRDAGWETIICGKDKDKLSKTAA